LLVLLVFTFLLFPLISFQIFSSIITSADERKSPSYPVSNVTPLIYQQTNTEVPNASPTPSYTPVLPTISFTPTPLAVGALDNVSKSITPTVLYVFKLSFYDPHIGYYFPDKAEINCNPWNFQKKDCDGKVNGGKDEYNLWYGRGIACPTTLEIGTELVVSYPPQLAGSWFCIDRGGLIRDNWIDFMLRYPDDIWTGENLDYFPWGSPVHAEIRVH